MSDLISRQAVEELSKELVHTTRDKADFLCNFWERLRKLPSAENKGKWILDETDNTVECNKCLCQIYPNDIFYGEPHFCPNCGSYNGWNE